MLCAEVQNLAPLILWGQERRKVVPMGAAAPTDGKQVLSAAGSPEGSRPFGKVSPQGRWEFPGKLPYLVWHIKCTASLCRAFQGVGGGDMNPV